MGRAKKMRTLAELFAGRDGDIATQVAKLVKHLKSKLDIIGVGFDTLECSLAAEEKDCVWVYLDKRLPFGGFCVMHPFRKWSAASMYNTKDDAVIAVMTTALAGAMNELDECGRFKRQKA